MSDRRRDDRWCVFCDRRIACSCAAACLPLSQGPYCHPLYAGSSLRRRLPAYRRRDDRRDRSRERGKDERDRRSGSGRERRDGSVGELQRGRPSGGLPPRAPSNPLMAEAYRLAKEKQREREREREGQSGAAAAASDDDEPVERPRECAGLSGGPWEGLGKSSWC